MGLPKTVRRLCGEPQRMPRDRVLVPDVCIQFASQITPPVECSSELSVARFWGARRLKKSCIVPPSFWLHGLSSIQITSFASPVLYQYIIMECLIRQYIASLGVKWSLHANFCVFSTYYKLHRRRTESGKAALHRKRLLRIIPTNFLSVEGSEAFVLIEILQIGHSVDPFLFALRCAFYNFKSVV